MIPLTAQYSDAALRQKLALIVKQYPLAGRTYIDAFTKLFCARCQVADGLCVNSGTNALILVLHALQIKAGEAILLPVYTCKAILDALMLLGIKPVLADNYLDYGAADFNLDEADARRRLDAIKVKAIILPYMFGKV